MGKARSPWEDGRRAWERLGVWFRGAPREELAVRELGDDALAVLDDVGLVRRLLDQAELRAVKAARTAGRSWSEIAVRLGVTRQSAWERWRDVDDADDRAPGEAKAGQVASSDAPPSVPLKIDDVTEGVLSRTARRMRRESSVSVPNVIGMSWDDARELVQERGLTAVGRDPDGVPEDILGAASGTVTDQSPEAGALVRRGAKIRLWLRREGGGSAGVREPRRPKPDPRVGRAMRPDPEDEAAS